MQERATLERQIARKRWMISRRANLADALAGTPPLDEIRSLTAEAEGLGFGDLEDVKVREQTGRRLCARVLSCRRVTVLCLEG